MKAKILTTAVLLATASLAFLALASTPASAASCSVQSGYWTQSVSCEAYGASAGESVDYCPDQLLPPNVACAYRTLVDCDIRTEPNPIWCY